MKATNDWLLVVVAIVSVLCAVLHVVFPELKLDQTTAMFLALAVVARIIHQITKFKGFGIEFEKKVEELEAAVGTLEKDVGPGSKTPAAPTAVASEGARTRSGEDSAIDPQDPNKGQFGGKPEANGRRLSASIEPTAGPRSARCRVIIKVESIDPARPLDGEVKLHLHPTFGRWSSYTLPVKGGVARDEIVSYGAFTIGVEADDGATRLELDLVNVPGGTAAFYAS